MSQLTSSPRITMPSRKYGVIPRLGVTGTLQAPGVYPDVAEIPKSRLVKAFGLGEGVAQLVGTLGAIAEKDQREADLRAMGEARKHFEESAPGYTEQIDKDEIVYHQFFEDNEDPTAEGAARRFVAMQLREEDGTSPYDNLVGGKAYLKQSAEVGIPYYAALFSKQIARMKAFDERKAAGQLGQSMYSAPNMASLKEVFESIGNLRINNDKTPLELAATYLLPLMKNAIASGDEASYNLMNQLMGEISPSASKALAAEWKTQAIGKAATERASKVQVGNNSFAELLNTGDFEGAKDLIPEVQADNTHGHSLRGLLAAAKTAKSTADNARLEVLVRDAQVVTSDPEEFRDMLVSAQGSMPDSKINDQVDLFIGGLMEGASARGDWKEVMRLSQLGLFKGSVPEFKMFTEAQLAKARKNAAGLLTEEIIRGARSLDVPPDNALEALFKLYTLGHLTSAEHDEAVRTLTAGFVGAWAHREDVRNLLGGFEALTTGGPQTDQARPITTYPEKAVIAAAGLLPMGPGEKPVVDVHRTSSGVPSLGKVNRPAIFAVLADASGKVPSEWATQITKGFRQGGAEEIATAGYHLHAISLQNRLLAEQVIAGMSPEQKFKAQAFLHYIEEEARSNALGSEEYMGIAKGLGVRVSEMAVLESTPEERRRVLWGLEGVGPILPAVTEGQVVEDITSALAHGYRENVNFLWLRNVLNERFPKWQIDADRDLAPISLEARSFYINEVEQVFGFRLSLGESTEVARTNAKALGLARLISKYPPMVWNNNIYFQSGGAVDPNFQANVEELLIQMRDAGELDAARGLTVDNIIQEYHPKWVERSDEMEVVRGWVMVRTGNADNKLPGFFIQVKSSQIEALRKMAEFLRKTYEKHEVHGTPLMREWLAAQRRRPPYQAQERRVGDRRRAAEREETSGLPLLRPDIEVAPPGSLLMSPDIESPEPGSLLVSPDIEVATPGNLLGSR